MAEARTTVAYTAIVLEPGQPTNAYDRNTVNNLVQGGYANLNDIVTESGTAGIKVWNWVNLPGLG